MGQLGHTDEASRNVSCLQSGRDEELIEQLNVLPQFVAAFGFSNAKAPGFEADDYLAAAVAA
jgi:DNA polymerase-1